MPLEIIIHQEGSAYLFSSVLCASKKAKGILSLNPLYVTQFFLNEVYRFWYCPCALNVHSNGPVFTYLMGTPETSQSGSTCLSDQVFLFVWFPPFCFLCFIFRNSYCLDMHIVLVQAPKKQTLGWKFVCKWLIKEAWMREQEVRGSSQKGEVSGKSPWSGKELSNPAGYSGLQAVLQNFPVLR